MPLPPQPRSGPWGFPRSFQKQEVLQPISTKISLYNTTKKNFPVLTPNTASLRKYRSFLSEMIFEVTTCQVIIKGEATICGK